jgi:hypothetical protein
MAVNLVTGLTLVGASPNPVTVTITLPAASGSPRPDRAADRPSH